MTKTFLAAAITAFVLVAGGCGGSGAKEAGPVPTGQGPQPSTSTGSTSTSGEATSTSTSSAPLCRDKTATVEIESQQGAAGTMSTIWRVTNTSASPCRSFGYPGMDFRSSGGWLGVQVHRGGYPNINEPPAPVALGPGESMYFASYWGVVDTDAGPCQKFDRVKVTLPDNFTSARLAASGCVDRQLVEVGPVSESRPS